MQEFLSKDCPCLNGLQFVSVVSRFHVYMSIQLAATSSLRYMKLQALSVVCPAGLVSAHRRSLVVAKGGHGPHGYANFPLGV